MSLSLEIKKFINSEHTGSYATLSLPVVPLEAKGKKPTNEGEEPPAEQAPEFVQAKMHYVEAGDGEPMILVHTIGQSLYTWRNVFDRLSQHYRVIAVDLFGHGYSDRPEAFGYTIRDHAETLGFFMDALGIESAHFVAFSMGCAYGMQFAMDNPTRVGRMVMIGPGGLSQQMPTPVKLMDSTIFGFAASMLYGMGTVRRLLEDCFFDLTHITDEVVQEYYRPASDNLARRMIRYSLHFFDDTELLSHLREINVPLLMLQGSEDKWRSAAQAELYHAAMPQVAFSVVRNAGHLLHEEKPQNLVSAVLEFIPVVMMEA